MNLFSFNKEKELLRSFLRRVLLQVTVERKKHLQKGVFDEENRNMGVVKGWYERI